MATDKEGYTKHYRKIRHHWLRERARKQGFDDEHAWLDLIDLANHKTEKFIYRGEVVDGERGTVYRSKAYLAKEWGWSETRVRRFLKLLESDGMIEVKSTNHLTAVKVVNYAVYQGPESEQRRTDDGQSDGQMADTWRTSDGQAADKRRTSDGQAATYNNSNNYKEFNKNSEEDCIRAREAPSEEFPDDDDGMGPTEYHEYILAKARERRRRQEEEMYGPI